MLTCDASVTAASDQLPVSVESFEGMALVPGTNVFVGQYLFTGSETTSVYLTVTEVRSKQVIGGCGVFFADGGSQECDVCGER